MAYNDLIWLNITENKTVLLRYNTLCVLHCWSLYMCVCASVRVCVCASVHLTFNVCIQRTKWCLLFLSFTCHLTHKNIFLLTHVDKYTSVHFNVLLNNITIVLYFVVSIKKKGHKTQPKVFYAIQFLFGIA